MPMSMCIRKGAMRTGMRQSLVRKEREFMKAFVVRLVWCHATDRALASGSVNVGVDS